MCRGGGRGFRSTYPRPPDHGFTGGRVVLQILVTAEGKVADARLSDEALESTELGACILGHARRLVFPRFEGPSVEVATPLVLASGG